MTMQVPEFFNLYARMIRQGKNPRPIVIDEGYRWGVGIGKSDPGADEYYQCESLESAQRLKGQIEGDYHA